MLVPVAVLAVLATIGGLLRSRAVRHPFTHWVEQAGEPLVEATAGQDYSGRAISALGRRTARTPRLLRGSQP